MFDYHRKSPWFAEKYDPALQYANLRARVRKVGWRGRIDVFLSDLDAGKYDPDPQDSQLQDAPSSPVKDSMTNGVPIDASHVESEDTKPNLGGDDEMQFNVEAEDDNNDQDGPRGEGGRSDTKRGKTNEEIAVDPDGNQVMIRTIPPDIGRLKLESVRRQGVTFDHVAEVSLFYLGLFVYPRLHLPSSR